MSLSAAQLLRTLGSGLIPTPATSRPGAPSSSGGVDFASLLQRAQRGALPSHRGVTIDPAAGADLSPDQLDRLAQATDAAEVAGATRLFAILDGKGVVVDVATRTVRAAVDLTGVQGARVQPANVLTGVDAVAVVPAREEDAVFKPLGSSLADRRAALAPLAGLIGNGSLRDRLAGLSLGR